VPSSRRSRSRRADDEAAVIAANRIRNGAADHKEDGTEALARLGIEIPPRHGRPAPPKTGLRFDG
jgi:hypothetical protein